MSWYSKVIWSEGGFIRPQHFQQQDRYHEQQLELRCHALRPYSWGILSLQIDEGLLGQGKFALIKCKAIMPDGTVVNIPDDQEPPPPITLPGNTRNEIVYLTLPLKLRNIQEIREKYDTSTSVARYCIDSDEVRDNSAQTANAQTIMTGRLHLTCALESEKEKLKEHTVLGFARIKEVRGDKTSELDNFFIPPTLDCRTDNVLSAYLKKLLGWLHHRGDALAQHASDAGQNGVRGIRDFMFLQVVNRAETVFLHLAEVSNLHPEVFYRELVQLAGDLATFAHPDRRPNPYPAYKHDDLEATFRPVMNDLQQFLSQEIDVDVIQIPLQYRGPGRGVGLHVALVNDTQGNVNLQYLLSHANFVLAAKANVDTAIMHKEFPVQVKIGSAEKINRMVNLNLPGIRIEVSPVAQQRIPYHKGFVYFDLDQQNEYWKELLGSTGLAIHIGDRYQDIELELWAIKEQVSQK